MIYQERKIRTDRPQCLPIILIVELETGFTNIEFITSWIWENIVSIEAGPKDPAYLLAELDEPCLIIIDKKLVEVCNEVGILGCVVGVDCGFNSPVGRSLA